MRPGMNMRCLHRLICLHARSPLSDLIWEGRQIFTRYSLHGGGKYLVIGPEVLKVQPTPC